MKKSDLKPGTKVLVSIDQDEYGYDDGELVTYFYDQYEETTLFGEVLDKPASAGHVWVRWDQEKGYDSPAEEEQEVEIKLLTLEAERSKIEAEFKNTAKAIKEKMKEAAKLIREANSLVKTSHSAKNLSEMYDAVSPLIGAMDDSGWRSSSWGC